MNGRLPRLRSAVAPLTLVIVGVSLVVLRLPANGLNQPSSFSTARGDQQAAAEADTDMTLSEYARLCVERIGEIPPLDYRKGVVIPITVDGKLPEKYEPGMDCDCPSLTPNLGCDGQCVPYSRVQLLRDDRKTQMVALFRRKIIRDKDNPLFDEIDLIVHSVVTGDTCWFRATANNPNCDARIGLRGDSIPVPQAPDADSVWNSPRRVVEAKCGMCHDNDPFYYSPYIAQVTNQVPADPLGKYSNAIGPFKQWPKLECINSRGNTCTSCHRIGTQYTSGDGLLSATGALKIPQGDVAANKYPHSHWMPAHNFLTKAEWEVVYRLSAKQLYDWHQNPKANSEITVTPIPSGK